MKDSDGLMARAKRLLGGDRGATLPPRVLLNATFAADGSGEDIGGFTYHLDEGDKNNEGKTTHTIASLCPD